jgi:catechol 2,3-dioxygenase-like lactoylglutathione lyase family enzyme
MIDRIDHIVINCRDVEETASWYVRVLGLEREEFGPDRRIALKFGSQKLNLRPTGAPDWATGAVDEPGSVDLCFITEAGLAHASEWLRSNRVEITAGPVPKMGALGPMMSIYCRDPDGNLIEIGSYRDLPENWR